LTVIVSIMTSRLLGRLTVCQCNREPHGFRKAGGDCAGRITQTAERD
jgi:hypothetical protein